MSKKRSKHHKKRQRKKKATHQQPASRAATPQKVAHNSRWLVWATLFVFTIGILAVGFHQYINPWFSQPTYTPNEIPTFQKHGELTLKSDFTAKTIEIEIVETEAKITQGLMYRPSMQENRGMLFVFTDTKPRSFWMKNTPISLDIVFIDDQKTIVAIQANTTPFSEQSLPSHDKAAKYVLEVNAGFMARYGFKEGDKIDFNRLNNN